MSCSCYSQVGEPVAVHHVCSPSYHRRAMMHSPGHCMEPLEDPNHYHCCSPNNYCSSSHRHLPSVASPLHISHPHNHTGHYPHQIVYHTPQHHRHGGLARNQVYTTPQAHSQLGLFHSRRELIPSPSINPNETTPTRSRHISNGYNQMSEYAQPLSQTPPTSPRNPSFVCPSSQLEFSPISSNDSPCTIPYGFQLSHDEKDQFTVQLASEKSTKEKRTTTAQMAHTSCSEGGRMSKANQSVTMNHGDSKVEKKALESKNVTKSEMLDTNQCMITPGPSNEQAAKVNKQEKRKSRNHKNTRKSFPNPSADVVEIDSEDEIVCMTIGKDTTSSKNKDSEGENSVKPPTSFDLKDCKIGIQRVKMYPIRSRLDPTNISSKQSDPELQVSDSEKSSSKEKRRKSLRLKTQNSVDSTSDGSIKTETNDQIDTSLGDLSKPPITSETKVEMNSSINPEITPVESNPLYPELNSQDVIDCDFIDVSSHVVPSGENTGRLSAEVVLVDWYLKVMPKKSVTLFGIKDHDLNGRLWHSGPIVECVSPRVLVTKSGSTYRLKGAINMEGMNTANACISSSTIRKFKNGFPKLWKKIIQDIDKPSSEPLSMKDTPTLQPATPTPLASVEVKTEEKKLEVKVEPSPHTPSLSQLDSSNNSGFLSTLKRSSRGRTLKPSMTSLSPYIQTSGDIYSYDMHGNFRGLASPLIDLTLSDVEDVTPSYSKKKGVVSRHGIKKEDVKKEDEEFVFPKEKVETSQPQDDDSRPTCTINESVQTEDEASSLGEDRQPLEDVSSPPLADDSSQPPADDKRVDTESDSDVGMRLRRRKKTLVLNDDNSESESAADTRHRKPTKVKGQRKQTTPAKSGQKIVTEQDNVDTHEQPVSVPIRRKSQRNIKETLKADPLSPSVNTNKTETDPVPITRKSQRNIKQTYKSDAASDPLLLVTSSVEKPATISNKSNGAPKPTDTSTSTENKTPQSSKVKKNRRKCVLSAKKPKRVRPADEVEKAASIDKPPSMKPQARQNKPKDRLKEDETDLTADGWTAETIARLKRMVREVPALSENFWEVVATRLSTGHSARECSLKYQEVCTRPLTQKQKPTKQANEEQQGKKEDKKTITITGKAGTLKRKRQLRNAMEHMDKGYVDDIFDSTPFKKKVKTIVKIPDWSDSNSEGDSSEDSSEEEEEFYTPHTTRKRLGAPELHTPTLCDLITTPDLKSGLKRDAADNVMFRIQKAKKPKAKRPTKPHSVPAPKRPKPSLTRPLFSEQKLRSIRTGEMKTLRMFEDTDEDESDDDYPFSDIDEAYKDILDRVH